MKIMNFEFSIPNLELRAARWLAPSFFLALFAAFILLPFSLKDKLDAVCFGI